MPLTGVGRLFSPSSLKSERLVDGMTFEAHVSLCSAVISERSPRSPLTCFHKCILFFYCSSPTPLDTDSMTVGIDAVRPGSRRTSRPAESWSMKFTNTHLIVISRPDPENHSAPGNTYFDLATFTHGLN